MLIQRLIADIDSQHERTIRKKISGQSVRALELWWNRKVYDHHHIHLPTWTGRDRQSARIFFRDFLTLPVKDILEWSITHWTVLSHTLYLRFLPPKPLWQVFFIHRDKFYVAYCHHQKIRQATQYGTITQKSTDLNNISNQQQQKRQETITDQSLLAELQEIESLAKEVLGK